MEYEVFQVKDSIEYEWRVDAIDYDSEGEIYMALFFGLKAEERAKEYAKIMNEKQEG